MRVDTGPAPSGYPTEPPDTTQIRLYWAAIRRRWPVIVVFTLVGALVGWFSTPGAAEDTPLGPTYYKAIHTLILETNADGSTTGAGANLTQTAFFVSTGDIPRRVAERLGVDVSEVDGHLLGKPQPSVGSVEVIGIGTDPQRTTSLADTAAAELLTYLNETETANYDASLADVRARLDELQVERENIQAQIAADPAAADELDAQYQSVVNRYAATYEQFQQIASQGVPDAGLRTLQPATAQPISDDAFDEIQDEIALGAAAYTSTTLAGDQPSSAPGLTSEPDPKLRAALGGFGGMGAAVALVLVLDRFDTRLRRREEIEAVTGLPVLAEIPPMNRHQQHSFEVAAQASPRSRAAESYRVVRTALLFAMDLEDGPGGSPLAKKSNGDATRGRRPDGARVVMVTSSNPEEGKTTTVANLAAVLAEGGLSVLVLNCDFRRPRVHKYLAGPEAAANAVDLTQAVRTADLPDVGKVVAVPTSIERVKLVTGVGEHQEDVNPLEVVAVQRRIIQTARKAFDIVLLDTAPFLTTNDASELLGDTDYVLMVVRNGKTKREPARRTAEVLERFDAEVLGVVLNGADETPAAQYYYTYYLDSTGSKQRSGGYVSSSRGRGRANGEARPNGNGAAEPAEPAAPTQPSIWKRS